MESEQVNERDAIRQLANEFQWTNLSRLKVFIDELDARASRIAGQNRDWDREFRRAWGALEETYAVMVDREMVRPDAPQAVIASAIERLRSMPVEGNEPS